MHTHAHAHPHVPDPVDRPTPIDIHVAQHDVVQHAKSPDTQPETHVHTTRACMLTHAYARTALSGEWVILHITHSPDSHSMDLRTP